MSDQSHLVSVVLPTHNRVNTLREAIHSVIDQTYRNLELIVVDDASTDATAQIAEGIADPRIRLLRHDTNRGAPAARNTGIAAARGEFIAFQDSDDAWLPEKLARQMAVFAQSPANVGAVYCAMLRFGGAESTAIPGPQVTTRHGDFSRQLLFDNFVGTPTLVVKRPVLEQAGPFWEALPRFQDWELALRLSHHCRFGFVDDVLVHFRDTPGNISSDDRARTVALEMILHRHEKRFRSVPQAYAKLNFAVGQSFALNGEFRLARRHFRRGIAATPLAVRPWAGLFATFLGRQGFATVTAAARAMRQP